MIKDLHPVVDAWEKEWPLLKSNREYFRNADRRIIAGLRDGEIYSKVLLKYRKASLSADLAAIEKGFRPCFLCDNARPKEQKFMKFKDYKILANPYPASGLHFTVVNDKHIPQSISGRIIDMLELADRFRDMSVFYNGPRCGASAPDHQHFQMIQAGDAKSIMRQPDEMDEIVMNNSEGCKVMINKTGAFGFITVNGNDFDKISAVTDKVLLLLGGAAASEPMVNIIAYYNDGMNVCIIPRKAHRPACYGTEEGKMLVSPASIEMLGAFIMSRDEDFNRLSVHDIEKIYGEVAYSIEELKNKMK